MLLFDRHSFFDCVCGLGGACLRNTLKCTTVVLKDSINSLSSGILEVEDDATELVRLNDLQDVSIATVELDEHDVSHLLRMVLEALTCGSES
jgi:hypothetical protein